MPMYFDIQEVWQRKPPLRLLVASYLGFNAEENMRQKEQEAPESKVIKNPTIGDLRSFLGQI